MCFGTNDEGFFKVTERSLIKNGKIKPDATIAHNDNGPCSWKQCLHSKPWATKSPERSKGIVGIQ